MSTALVIGASFGYLALLFGIAWWAERRGQNKRSLVANPWAYALSLAVYCTAWTYYGSVGRAAMSGIEFAAIYIGPTLLAPLWYVVLRKLIRISKMQRISSIADLVSARYGRSSWLGALVTVFCIVGIIPYISIQLKAVGSSFDLITAGPELAQRAPLLTDTTFYLTLGLAAFIILFGTRTLDATERHEGLVAAIAFESVVKLVAFLTVGLFVTYGLFNGFGDLFGKAERMPELQQLFTLQGDGGAVSWSALILLSMMAFLLLPRQFQVAVVENLDERHTQKAMWIFPLYLLLINLFVLPIAFAGRLLLDPAVDADTYVLSLPLANGANGLALLTYLGGFSAATGMIIVATIALSTMLSNNLLMPAMLSLPAYKERGQQPTGTLLLAVRRAGIVLILLLSYAYFRTVSSGAPLVSVGLVSFAAVVQFAPAVFGGIYWKRANRQGAVIGIVIGFAVWAYTLVVPGLIRSGALPLELSEQGLFGIAALKPQLLFGDMGLDPLTHAVFWSLLLNGAGFALGSLISVQDSKERNQAEVFVDVFKYARAYESSIVWKGTAQLSELRRLLANFIEPARAERALEQFARRNSIDLSSDSADPRLVTYVERVLSGIIGAASARIMVSNVVKEEEIRLEEVFDILRGSQQLMALNKELRRKSEELDHLTQELRRVNEDLRRSDELKDEFLYTVTHELRTPLTSIRALSEILHDNPDIDEAQRQQFLGTMVRETERLSRLIEQVLDLEKLESGKQKLNEGPVHLPTLVEEAVDSVGQLLRDKGISIQVDVQRNMRPILGDGDRIEQVMINLLGNAVKFCPEQGGRITVSCYYVDGEVKVHVTDNGPGVEPAIRKLIFDKFFQARQQHQRRNTSGSGLGLAICRNIVVLHGGRIWVESNGEQGARFSLTLPALSPKDQPEQA
ncbi:MAG: sodium:proline symporter [Flavobacteriales bacterium]|nr:sodium:proline symporter [Flavobacteriales bacterium]